MNDTTQNSAGSPPDGRRRTEDTLAKMVEIIRGQPGIRPSELNRRLGKVQTDQLRAILIRRGLVRKVAAGRAIHLYAVDPA